MPCRMEIRDRHRLRVSSRSCASSFPPGPFDRHSPKKTPAIDGSARGRTRPPWRVSRSPIARDVVNPRDQIAKREREREREPTVFWLAVFPPPHALHQRVAPAPPRGGGPRPTPPGRARGQGRRLKAIAFNACSLSLTHLRFRSLSLSLSSLPSLSLAAPSGFGLPLRRPPPAAAAAVSSGKALRPIAAPRRRRQLRAMASIHTSHTS
ncbi:hypothetical protein NL676_010103 [Syzygium grande]|nr:hypothetical protein NL676_010103 [Syzygium grande]